MKYEILKKEIVDGIATITISRPKAMNALNTRFFNEMDQMVEEISADKDVKIMIITGEGKAFVAGADIAEMANKTSEEGTEFSAHGQKTFSSFAELGVPVIAAVNGFIVQASINAFVILLVYRQMASTQRRLQTVQENVAETIRRYGRNSLEARQALRQLEQAQENARLAQIGFYFQLVFTIGSVATLIARIPLLIAQLQALAASYSTVAASATAANIAMGPAGWALLGLGAGAAITIGGIYLMGGFGGGEAEFDRQWSEAGRYVKQRAFRESRRYG